MELRFEVNCPTHPDSKQILALFEAAGISSPLWSPERMDRALQGSAVVACAWNGDDLVGFARVVSDLAWIAYIAQLAVHPEHQGKKIGRRLVDEVRRHVGEGIALLVHSADRATGFYEAMDFTPYANVYRYGRKK